jgi:hypothetical protein
MVADGRVKDLVVQIHGAHHVVGVAAQESSAADHIGRENRSFSAVRRRFQRFVPGHW